MAAVNLHVLRFPPVTEKRSFQFASSRLVANAGVVDHEYTRITEFKHLTGQQHAGTSVVREYPQNEGDPYYPVPRPENESLFKRYEALARKERHVTFVGRLAQYRYYNMDQCVGAALKAADNILEALGRVAKLDRSLPEIPRPLPHIPLAR